MKTLINLLIACASLMLASAAWAQTNQLMRSTFDDCDGVALTGLQPQLSPDTWGAVFGAAWPQPFGNGRNVSITVGSIVSLQFVANPATPLGTIEALEAPGLPAGVVSMSISTCRGDLRPHVLRTGQGLCLSSGTAAPSLVWVMGQPPSPDYCTLVPGATYWLNLAHIQSPYEIPAPTTCVAAACTARLITRSFARAGFEWKVAPER